MAIKVGNSYVSEAAYAQAKAKIEGEQEVTSSKNSYSSSLRDRFHGWNITTNTQPNNGNGLNNIGVSSKILSEMANNPQKRLEYEALMIDCQEATKSLALAFKSKGLNLVKHGFIIGADGSLSSWGVVESGGSKNNIYSPLPKNNKGSWQNIIMGSLPDDKYGKYNSSGVDFKA